ncbi:MAG: hypothetical protein H7138_07415 [Myxococcales bacterium]|nr:hypothetical protein [Myxococcales bacterium]
MRVPVWLTLGIALLVCVFGLYRIRLALRSEADNERAKGKRGMYAMARRTHALIGIVYLLLGGALIATSYGWNPFGSLFGPKTEVPAKDAAPTYRTIPIDNLPKPVPAPTTPTTPPAATPPAAEPAPATAPTPH